jgi:hypothetical protein
LPLLAVASLISGCDASSKLFSEAERRSIYTLSLEADGARLASSSVVKAGAAITVGLSRMSGTTSPESLELVLLDASGSAVAGLRYSTPKDGAATAKSVGVADLGSSLPRFALPADLQPGVYSLMASLRDSGGALLQESETVLFVGEKGLELGSLSVYPPTSAPNSAVLLSATIKTEAKDASPSTWLSWSSDGRVFAEGLLGDGYDKAVWTAPSRDGAYSVELALYPSRPSPKLAKAESPWHQEIKAIVSSDAAIAGDEYAQVDRLPIHLAFAGDLLDSGTRSQAEKPEVIGKPGLESYPGGFGYRLGPEAGVRLPEAAPPLIGRTLAPASFLWRLYASARDGILYRLVTETGADLMVMGLLDGSPYIETVDAGGRHRFASSLHFSGGLLNLGLGLEPSSGGYKITWSLDGQASSSSIIPASNLPDRMSSVLGGPASLPGVWDEFAVSDDATGAPALFFAAAARTWRKDLLIAEGFEAATLPSKAIPTGQVTVGSRILDLAPGSSLSYSSSISFARPLTFSLAWLPSSPPPAMDFRSEEGELLFRVSATGQVSLGDGSPAGSVVPADKGLLSFTVRSNAETFEIAAKDSLLLARFSLASAPASAFFSLSNPATAGTAEVVSILARVATDAISLGTVKSMALGR